MRHWLLLLGLLLLTACAQLPTAPASGYALSGRLSIRDGKQNQQALFGWQTSAAQDRLSFDSPLGQTLAALTIQYDSSGYPVSATLEQGGTTPVTASDPQALLYQLTGLSLPLGGLRWWLRGEAAPFSPAERSETDGTVTLRQDGWQIEARDFRPLGQHQQPYRIDARRDDIQLRIVISDASTDLQTTP
ncbi:outer membrane lipoprotein LolB [Chitinilyticum aquatile]|uniref:outer membrane lipoprotein LolB n=1 Tax=Chitinilyticum aquatile TaxID=362520 RepID=UPI00040D167A|nr:outer membrane lipoprotein LolB [Chitinilyticum aquatile]